MKDFDELLDRVLREDAAVPPCAGLETRVMARVRGEERLLRSFVSWCLNRWRGWLLVPAAACLGIVAMVWYGSGGDMSQPSGIASRVTSPDFSARSVGRPEIIVGSQEMEGDSRSSLSRSGRALRDAHLSDDKTVAKMGHPVLGAREAKPLPKLDVFPQPVPASNEEGQLATLVTKSEKIGAALATLQQERNEPIRIAAIEIAPLTIKPIGGLSEGFTK